MQTWPAGQSRTWLARPPPQIWFVGVAWRGVMGEGRGTGVMGTGSGTGVAVMVKRVEIG
jgi:hypothetical protein